MRPNTRSSFAAKQVLSSLQVVKSSPNSLCNNQLLLRKTLPVATYTCNQHIFTGKHKISSEFNLLYEGTWSKRLRYLRWTLLTGAVLGQQINPAALFMGIATTFMIHKRSKGYVYQFYFDPKKKNVLLFTWSLLGIQEPTFFNINDATNVTDSSFKVGTDTFLIHLGTEEAGHVMDIMAGKMKIGEQE